MSDVKWIKIAADLFDNDKILLIESMPGGDAAIVLWIKLLCLAGKQNNSGVFRMGNGMAYTDRMFAVIFREAESTVRTAFDLFEQFGMIETIDGVVTIPGWGEHQSLDKIEKNNKYQQEYMREYRKRQRSIARSGNDDNVDAYTDIDIDIDAEADTDSDADDVTDADNDDISNDNADHETDVMDDCPNSKPNSKPNGKPNSKPNSKPNGKPNSKPNGKPNSKPNVRDPDKNREDKKRKDKKKEGKEKETKPFTPPPLEEVADYCRQRGNGIDPQQFIDHYEAVGWMVGKSNMKDWRASVRTWERNDIARKKQRPLSENVEQIGADHSWGGFDD